jgi:hypothetical protein
MTRDVVSGDGTFAPLSRCWLGGAESEEMTKTQGLYEPPKPMTTAERNAREAFRQVDADKAMTEHEKAQKAFHKNRERLKAERLAREAAGAATDLSKAKSKT